MIVPRFFIAYCFLVLVVAYFIFASSVEPAEDTRVTSTVQSTITVDYLRELVTDDFIYWRVMVVSHSCQEVSRLSCTNPSLGIEREVQRD